MSDTDSGRESPVVNYRPRTAYHHPKLIDNDRNTKLHYVAARNDVNGVVNYLDKESHIVDPQNYLGWTPLMMACRKGYFETVKCLLSYRANATKKNKFGMNVFQIAVASGNLELVEYLLEHFLVGGISKRILEYNFPVASLAILFRHQSILEFLINKHFKINEGTVETGVTPFMFAHAMENDAAISMLLKHKVDTKIKNCLGHTAVDIATIRHQMKYFVYGRLYFKSLLGIFKICEIILCLLAVIIVVSQGGTSVNIKLFYAVTISGIVISFLIFLLSSLGSFCNGILKFQFAIFLIFFLCILIISSIVTAKYSGAYKAGGVFGLLSSGLYLGDAAISFKAYRN